MRTAGQAVLDDVNIEQVTKSLPSRGVTKAGASSGSCRHDWSRRVAARFAPSWMEAGRMGGEQQGGRGGPRPSLPWQRSASDRSAVSGCAPSGGRQPDPESDFPTSESNKQEARNRQPAAMTARVFPCWEDQPRCSSPPQEQKLGYKQGADTFIAVPSNPAQGDLRHYCWK